MLQNNQVPASRVDWPESAWAPPYGSEAVQNQTQALPARQAPHPISSVASYMCASARNVIIPPQPISSVASYMSALAFDRCKNYLWKSCCREMLPIIYIAIPSPLAKALPKLPIAARFFLLLVIFCYHPAQGHLGKQDVCYYTGQTSRIHTKTFCY